MICCSPIKKNTHSEKSTENLKNMKNTNSKQYTAGMVKIPSGTWKIGSEDNEAYIEDCEGPIRTLDHDQFVIDKTCVSFNKLSSKDINYYITNYEPFNKAGGYGIQDWGATFVKKINGCYYNVVGFPLSKFYILFNQIKNK